MTYPCMSLVATINPKEIDEKVLAFLCLSFFLWGGGGGRGSIHK